MRKCDTGYFIVKPSTYDKCECCQCKEDDVDNISTLYQRVSDLCSLLNELRSMVASYASSIPDVASINAIVNDIIAERIRNIDARFEQLSAKIPDNITTSFNQIWVKLEELERAIESSSTPVDLTDINNQLRSHSDRLTAIENQLLGLNVDTIKQLILDSITNSLGGRITALENNYTTLDTNITNLSGDLQSHINNTEYHVSAEDRAKWNAASGSTGGWDIGVIDGTTTLNIQLI